MDFFYRQLLPNIASTPLAETKRSYFFLTERHLQAAWLEQRYFKFLKTIEGDEIRVISPGIWNLNAGPDFLKAHLVINEQEVKGDVEIHLTSSDWYHHGHHQDPRYNNVVLHVVFWNSRTLTNIMTECKKKIPETFLEDVLTILPERISSYIDLDLYPHQIFAGSGHCAKHLFKTLTDSTVRNFFQSAAAWRLVNKYEYISVRVEDPELFLAVGMAMALGYKNNTETFLKLFLHLYPLRHCGEQSLLAIAMGITGFFQSPWQEKWSQSDTYRYLQSLYLMQALTQQPMEDFKLQFHQARPLNQPLRRIVTLVKLISDPNLLKYSALLEENWNLLWPSLFKKQKWNRLIQSWLNVLPSYPDNYWNHHYAFENHSSESSLSLLGAPLKQEIITNTLFPLLYHHISKRAENEEFLAFFNLYSSLMAPSRNKLKYLQYRFFGDAQRKNILAKADLEQGAYQLHKDFCLHYEASCEGCPFVENFLTLKNSNNFIKAN